MDPTTQITTWEIALALGVILRMLIPFLKKKQIPTAPPGTPQQKTAFQLKFLASAVVTWLLGGGLALISSDYYVALANIPLGTAPTAFAAFVIGLGGLDAINKLLTG